MKPYSIEIWRLYTRTKQVWRSLDDPGLALGDLVASAWRELFNEPLDFPHLPEPYDMLDGNKLYVMGNGRYLWIRLHPFVGAEIRRNLQEGEVYP